MDAENPGFISFLLSSGINIFNPAFEFYILVTTDFRKIIKYPGDKNSLISAFSAAKTNADSSYFVPMISLLLFLPIL